MSGSKSSGQVWMEEARIVISGREVKARGDGAQHRE